MGRPRKYASAADKQRAYRERQRSGHLRPVPVSAHPRQKSRPQRLQAVESELRDLAAGYQHWLDALPTNLSDTELAERLEAIAEQLDALADEVGDLEPPRGFGR